MDNRSKQEIIKIPVMVQDLDFCQTIRFDALLGYLFNTEEENLSGRGIGIRDLLKHQLSWVITRFSIEMNEFPYGKSTLSFKFWMDDIEGKFVRRSFSICQGEKELGCGSLTAAILDLSLRKSIPIEELPIYKQLLTNERREKIVPIPYKIEIQENQSILINTLRVGYCCVDVNVHANVLSYIRWIMDSFDLNFHRRYRVLYFTANFDKELLPDESVLIFKHVIDATHFQFELRNQHNIIVCLVDISFIERS